MLLSTYYKTGNSVLITLHFKEKTMTKHMKFPIYGFIGLISSLFMLAGCIIHVGASDANGEYSYASDKDYSSTNKSVSVASGKTIGDVSSVNGSISIDDNVTAQEVSNVNGRITIADNVSVESVSIVNGRIKIGENFKSTESVETVNGSIDIEEGSYVGGNIETVNGDVELDNVKVAQDIVTVNGDLFLKNGTIIEGDVRFEGKPSNSNWRKNPPTLNVDEGSKILGKIIIYKDVDFNFADPSMMEKVERR
jgi:DUF4097 and DUF4098 domain-containing protein YvlB